jgi:hypothetical protein
MEMKTFKEYLTESKAIIHAGKTFRTKRDYYTPIYSEYIEDLDPSIFDNSLPNWKKSHSKTKIYVKGSLKFNYILKFKKSFDVKSWWLRLSLNTLKPELIWDFLEIIDIEPVDFTNGSIQEHFYDFSEIRSIVAPINHYGDYSQLLTNKYEWSPHKINYLISIAVNKITENLKKQVKNKQYLINHSDLLSGEFSPNYYK